MKLEPVNDPLSLGEFFQAHAPDMFYVKRCSDGYGAWFEIRLPGKPILGYSLTWTTIAHIYSQEIDLHHPVYLLDIQRIVEQFEGLGGEQVTLRYANKCPKPEAKPLPDATRKMEP